MRTPGVGANRLSLKLIGVVGVCLSFASTAEILSVSYTYDPLNRLTHVNYASVGSIQYVYDASGAITSRVVALPDSDGDGVADNDDNCPQNGNPNQLDTDNDGLGNLCDPDDDNDGLSDTTEIGLGTLPLDTDTDDDGLDDGQEVDLGTDPLNEDSDDDEFSDGDEVDAGSNPLDGDDQPGPSGLNIILIKAAIDAENGG